MTSARLLSAWASLLWFAPCLLVLFSLLHTPHQPNLSPSLRITCPPHCSGSTYLSGAWGSDPAPILNRRSSSGPQPIPGKQRHGFGDGGQLSLPLESLLRPVRKVRGRDEECWWLVCGLLRHEEAWNPERRHGTQRAGPGTCPSFLPALALTCALHPPHPPHHPRCTAGIPLHLQHAAAVLPLRRLVPGG